MRSDAQDGPRARVRAWLPDVALALGVFVALNVLGSVLAGPRFDVTGAWISLPGGTGSSVFKAMLAATLIARGLGPLRRGGCGGRRWCACWRSRRRRRGTLRCTSRCCWAGG
ncbi:hypothetical protein OV079_30785 [Nannocystis pusilla]|uniref:Uncharacterized protein n=1 Tax=Nannocystis pusilla TaxID=889268 RepID=A0A9X3ETU0_9BACT|nr:hypothetical protein [Nannocystis pusilla]MCY1009871.1 hypothetical protein [Nannocystis pusilla]